MDRLLIAPIVEGHGEVQAIRILIERIWTELLGSDSPIDILRPIRKPRSLLPKPGELERAVRLAGLKLKERLGPGDSALILVLLDANSDAPCLLGPELLQRARQDTRVEIVCVLANVEYETWFVAAADSLREYLEIGQDETPPGKPEETKSGKGWIQARFRGVKYSETVDQPAMTACMDLASCRERSPSFDKLCRDLAKMQPGTAVPETRR